MTRIVVGGKEMPTVASAVREHLHPLHHLRRFGLLRRALALFDVPVWSRVHGVRWRVRTRLVRDISYRLLRGSPEPHVTSLVHVAVSLFRPRSFWDVGAYFGYYGLLVKSLSEQTEVVFCEPDPQNAVLIRETLGAAQIDGTRVIQAAVGAAVGRAPFVADLVSGATGSLVASESAVHRERQETTVIEVATVTLDEAVSDGSVDMLKIDVEGLEEDVVRGGRRLFERCRPLVVFECFHGGDEICAFLEGLGYEIFDAERLDSRLPQTSNFFGLPPQHRPLRDELLQRWRERLGAS